MCCFKGCWLAALHYGVDLVRSEIGEANLFAKVGFINVMVFGKFRQCWWFSGIKVFGPKMSFGDQVDEVSI